MQLAKKIHKDLLDEEKRWGSIFHLSIDFSFIVYGFYVVIDTFIYGNSVSGWPTLTVAIMFFSGIQLLSIGIVGEYIGQIFNEVKKRPLYLIADDISSEKISKN